MSGCGRDCDCRGLSRRELLQLGIGAVAVGAAAGSGAFAAPGDFPPSAQTPPPPDWFDALFKRGEPIVYAGDNLKEVAFPLGGIGTGTIWLHGTGQLVNWQIFNNINRSSQVDDSFLAVRIEEPGKPPIVRALQIRPVGPIKPMPSVRFHGQYPFAFLDFEDPAAAVKVRLEAFNPLIPLDDKNSGLPCAIFRIIVTNPTNKPVKVAFLASLQNAVGHQDGGASVGVRHPTYGRNVNVLARNATMTAVNMSAEPGVPAELGRSLTVFADHNLLHAGQTWPIRNLTARGVAPRMDEAVQGSAIWLHQSDPSRLGGGLLGEIARAVGGGATLFLTGTGNGLLQRIEPKGQAHATREEVTFADFEGPGYGMWKAQGAAFGEAPAAGTAPNQQPVGGFVGGGLVNTFLPDDGPRGRLTSPPFTIRHRYITFLIGGGNKPGRCCLNLRVNDRVVRTATGKDREQLDRELWDVQDLMGSEAVLEIVDDSGEGWGHINVDDIRFSNVPPDTITEAEAKAWNELIPIVLPPADPKVRREDRLVEFDRKVPELSDIVPDRMVFGVVPARQPTAVGDGVRTLIQLKDGIPLLLVAARGKGRVIAVPADLGSDAADPVAQRDGWLALIAGLMGVPFHPAAGRPSTAPSYGTMCLATPDPKAAFTAAWRDREQLLKDFAEDGALSGPDRDGPTEGGVSINAALAIPGEAPPGGAASAEFVFTWHFPNLYYPQGAWRVGPHNAVAVGNMYDNWFRDAVSVAGYVLGGLGRLREQTERFRAALYDSTLPHYLADCIGANVSILRSPTCFRTKAGTFYGFEGCNADSGCCPMNCNHVWNYEQALAKLWPSLERDMRVTELVFHQQPDGGLHHRVGVPRENTNRTIPVADGQCGAVLKAWREHLQSGGREFLNEHWPRIRKAMDFAITNWDADADGVMDRPQFNTYDEAIDGQNSFVSSLYLAALRAAEEMARLMKDEESARRYRALFESGRRMISQKLFDGEYYIQISDNLRYGYGKGCLSDQVVGQWWARVLNLGDILPVEQVRSALRSIFKYSWLTSQKGFQGTQRFLRFADGDDKALLIASWPKGGRPDEPIYYRDEAWTGVEYEVAAHMIYEGLLREGLAIVKGARERYDGRKRNPWNEIECGDYYVRALSSWSLLLAAQGYMYDGPARVLGFAPRLHPDDHRSLFTAAEGWGQFSQKREARRQINRILLTYGRLEVSRLILRLPDGAGAPTVQVTAAGRQTVPTVAFQDGTLELAFPAPVTIQADQAIEIVVEWS